jgi:hypothetical protein
MSVTTTTASQYSQCQFYKVQLNPASGIPVITTMQGYHNNRISNPCIEAWLPPYQMSVPAGKTHCFSKNGLRYFYKINSQTNRVLANSLFSQHGKPRNMCTGVEKIVEYLVHN